MLAVDRDLGRVHIRNHPLLRIDSFRPWRSGHG
jgi:hypothetical protein